MNRIFESNIFSNTGFVLRKIIHLSLNFFLGVLVFGFEDNWVFPVAAIVLIVILVGEVIRLKTWMRLLINTAVEPILKHEEKTNLTGVFWGAVAILVVSFYAGPAAIAYGFLISAFSDPAAALFGKYLPITKLYKEKTLIGTTAFAVFASVITYLFFLNLGITELIVVTSVVMGVVLAITEMVSDPFDDNFTVLLVSITMMHFLL